MRMLIFVLILSYATTTAYAARPPVPGDQWTPYAHQWLSRAAVAESGWYAKRDHALMAWALVYGWRSRRKTERFKALRFVDHIRNYCSALGRLSTPTRRQTWVRNLPFMGVDTKPEGWQTGSWSRNLRRWRRVQKRMIQWGLGRVRDESKGRVLHWGSPNATLPDASRAKRAIDAGRWVKLDFGDTRNHYYGLAPRTD